MNIKKFLHLSKSIIIICFIFTDQNIISSHSAQLTKQKHFSGQELLKLKWLHELIELKRLVCEHEKIVTEHKQEIDALKKENEQLKELQYNSIMQILSQIGLLKEAENPSFDPSQPESPENQRHGYQSQWVPLSSVKQLADELDNLKALTNNCLIQDDADQFLTKLEANKLLKYFQENFVSQKYLSKSLEKLHENDALIDQLIKRIAILQQPKKD